MFSHFLSFFLIGLVQIVTTFWASVLAVRALPRREQKKFPHIALFAFLGILGIGLTFWVGCQTYRSEKEAATVQSKMNENLVQANEKLDQTKLALSESLNKEQWLEDQNNDLRAVDDTIDSMVRIMGNCLPEKYRKQLEQQHRHFERSVKENIQIKDSVSDMKQP